jgi:hypothetical protein
MAARQEALGCDQCASAYREFARQLDIADAAPFEDKEALVGLVSRRAFLAASMAGAAVAALSPVLGGAASDVPPTLGRISPSDTPGSVVSTLGRPRAIEAAHGQGDPQWSYPGMFVRFQSSRGKQPVVRQVFTTSVGTQESVLGLRVGDAMGRLSQLNGTALRRVGRHEHSVQGPGYLLSFLDDGARVTAISLVDIKCSDCGRAPAAPKSRG